MSLAALTICPKCAHNKSATVIGRCLRCVNGSKFEPKMVITTTNPYREERITKDDLDHFAYCYKIDKEFDCVLAKIVEEVKEKENMFDKFEHLKATYQGRPLVIDPWEVTDSCSPYETPTFGIKAHLSRGSVPYSEYSKNKKAEAKIPEIKEVIFNPPATIVIWKDQTKTVVKASNEEFDPEKGLAMAITKKMLGNKGNYFETIKKWVKPYEEKFPKPEIIKINAGLKPATFEFSLADVDISKLGGLIGTTKDGMKLYFGNHEKLDGEA